MESKASTALHDKLPDAGTVERVAQSAHEAIDRFAAKAGPAVEKLRTSASGAADTLQGRADRFVEMEDHWVETTRSYVRENPLTALGIAVVAGLVLSRLSSR